MTAKSNQSQQINELVSRGVEQVIDQKHLVVALQSGKKLRVKLGIDPTGPKIHLGRAIPLWKLRAFQDLGHQAIIVIGDFTAQIGDPSDKLSKRPMLTPTEISKNIKDYKVQLGKILDIKKVEWVFNSKWLAKLSFLETAQLAESFSLQQILARRNFKDRIGKQDDISLRELLYPLMQGYDSVKIKADVEIGGFDQLFNLMSGRKIQEHYKQKPQDILTTQMLEGTDGRKMSTSWGNVVTIMDEPKEMFGKLMSVKDELVSKYLLLCTRLSEAEVKELSHQLPTSPKQVKARMAQEVVGLYHGIKAAQAAVLEFDKIHKNKELPSEIPTLKITEKVLNLDEIMIRAGLASSKSEAKRLAEQSGVKVDGKIMTDSRAQIEAKPGTVIQVGSRKFVKLVR